MHTKMLEDATYEQLKSFLMDSFDELKRTMPELYIEMEGDLYEHIYGPHFTKWKYDCAVAKLVNKDGTSGPHWTLNDIVSYAKSHGASYRNYNEYDLAFSMNMVYSDYYGVISDSVDSYYRVAIAFLEDRDAPEGKAFLYYKAMHEGR